MKHDCIRCEDGFAVTEYGYCCHCHWAVRAEVEQGFHEIRKYLKAWALYQEWCAEHKVAA